MIENPRIVFMGTPEFAVASLRELVQTGHNVVAVVTAPDRPAGRGKKMRGSAVKDAAMEMDIPVLQPEKLKDPEFVQELRGLEPDIGVVVAFRMLPEVVWSMPTLGTFNLHASLLPQYRGAAPINWAVINGETRSGVTTFLLDHEIDTGNILLQESCDITTSDDAGSLHDRLMEIGRKLVVRTVDGLAKDELEPQPQPESEELKPAPKIFKEDCLLDITKDRVDVLNKIRGLSPYPAAFVRLRAEGQDKTIMFKIYGASLTDEQVDQGQLLQRDKNLMLGCKDGGLRLEEVQLEGKKRMPATALLNGWSPEGHEIL